MSFNKMDFKDLRDIHSLQKYNTNPDIGTEDDYKYENMFDMMGNIMDLNNVFGNLLKGDLSDLSKDKLLKTYEETASIYKKQSIDEEERIRLIKEFFDEILLLNSRSYLNNEIRPIL